MIKGFEKKPAAFAAEVRNTAEEHSLEELIDKARSKQDAVSAYAAVFLAVQKSLKLTPFDTQIIAGGFLDDENIAELATGEGKTIAAVFAAFMSVCRGERVHILTFNDYLAKRDREWMKPAYDLLGVSTAYITEAVPRKERRAAYKADVLYSTVKECGFDFLRDFLVFPPDEPVAGYYGKVIVDEADSLLIDEARIPMIAAGVMDVDKDEELPDILSFAEQLGEQDFGTDESTGQAFLTPSGEKKAEQHFGLDNIYDEENNDLLSKLNDCLKALYVLKEDKDYIVKDGAVRIIDVFTGRVAENRSYPGTLQSAVELKHGLSVTERGVIMGSIPVQFFLRQYKSVAGMTGTAMSAKDEFAELYGLIVKHIDPNTPSRREDLPIAVYYDEDSKLKAVAEEVVKAHEKRQPVLIGTADISQSEKLSAILNEAGIEHNVLNAKNDELEAEIIKNAGMPGAVTVSTNMAGRGVDIKLGGADEKFRDEAVETGGLYAIGTFLAESARINDQLRGRSARQGDPGQSRIFVSLDEPIMKICKLKKLVGAGRYPDPTTEEITEKAVVKEVSRLQVIMQGKTLDERVRLLKFTTIGEKHRDLTFGLRRRYLSGEKEPTIWQNSFPDLYEEAEKKYGADALRKTQAEYVSALINIHWNRYLEYTSFLREGIHLTAIGGKDPAEEYNIGCEEYYESIGESITEDMGTALEELIEKTPDGLKIPVPKKIYTYLLEDTGDELERRTLAEFLDGPDTEDEEYAEYYSDEADEQEETSEEETLENEPEDKQKNEQEAPAKEKKGFFSKLFGSRKDSK